MRLFIVRLSRNGGDIVITRLLLIGAVPLLLLVICLALVAFADANVRPIKLNAWDEDADLPETSPEGCKYPAAEKNAQEPA